MSAEMIALARTLRGLDPDTIYSMYLNAQRSYLRAFEDGRREEAEGWQALSGVLNACYEERAA